MALSGSESAAGARSLWESLYTNMHRATVYTCVCVSIRLPLLSLRAFPSHFVCFGTKVCCLFTCTPIHVLSAVTKLTRNVMKQSRNVPSCSAYNTKNVRGVIAGATEWEN